jgi:hypothetical protein
MERYEFCKNAKCAKLTIEIEGRKPLILISKSPPLVLEFDKQEETFTHRMNAPIERKFPFLIKGVEWLRGFWYWSGERVVKVDCPMPGTYPVLDTGGIRKQHKDKLTDLYWNDYNLFCYFDGKNPEEFSDYYSNNEGFCTYRVYGKDPYYKFFDRQGILYESYVKEKLTYKVECNACCKDNEILCDSKNYPGYTCYPIAPVNAKLARGKNNIARYWR